MFTELFIDISATEVGPKVLSEVFDLDDFMEEPSGLGFFIDTMQGMEGAASIIYRALSLGAAISVYWLGKE